MVYHAIGLSQIVIAFREDGFGCFFGNDIDNT